MKLLISFYIYLQISPINSSQSVITVPSKTRVGISPALLVIFTGTICFLVSFQQYFYLPEILLQEDMTFPQDVLDTLSMVSLPSTFLYILITIQLRHRLNLSFCNIWSIIEALLSTISLISNIIYILARPEQCLQIVGSISEDLSGELNNIIVQIEKLGFNKILEDSSSISAQIIMYCVTYSFILQTLFMLIYTTMSCSIYGENQYIFTIKEENNIYYVDVKPNE